ncbi:hypothetical protein L1049_010168 [Liquidambar formosana]|uniref:Uncharacterized protein n=1 Tax=Liquidambar formosana TaxID=63359 RepID=A0AAP0R433_LIQFO
MASSRIARFTTEVAPPQFISVMRRRATKMMETINEEERDVSANDYLSLSSKGLSSSSSSASSSTIARATTSTATNSNCFLKEVQRSLSILGH